MRGGTQISREGAREAGKRLGRVLDALCAMVAPGLSTAALEAQARVLIAKEGAEPAFLGYRPHGAPRPYPAALNVSINEIAAHGIPTEPERVIREGDLVKIDLGLRYRGVVVDAARSVLAGKGGSRARRLIEAARAACEAGIAALRPGQPLAVVAEAVEQTAQHYGVRVMPELGGHGVGRSVHEEPFVPLSLLHPPSPVRAVEGMMLAIEPHLTTGKGWITALPDGFTLRTKDKAPVAVWEETVWIGAHGAEILTHAQKREARKI